VFHLLGLFRDETSHSLRLSDAALPRVNGRAAKPAFASLRSIEAFRESGRSRAGGKLRI